MLLGKGDGAFHPALIYAVDSNPIGIAVGDFNKDNKLDIVTVGRDAASVLLGNGDGEIFSTICFLWHISCLGWNYGG